jgi:hypothetical protein
MSSTLKDTRSALRATPAWAGNFVQTLLGSRFFLAVTAIFFLSFLAHVSTAQERFPPFTRIALSAVSAFAPQAAGPAPALPEEVNAQVQQAVAAGMPYAQAFLTEQVLKVRTYYDAHPQAVVTTNYIGLGVSGLLFMLALYLLARQGSLRRDM